MTKAYQEKVRELIGKKIFHIEWKKKNPKTGVFDVPRKGEFRLGVQKWKEKDGTKKKLAGGKRTTNPDQYLIAFDLAKRGFRNIKYDTINSIKADGEEYFISTIKFEDLLKALGIGR